MLTGRNGMAVAKYKRVLLKLGGESLAGPGGFGIGPHMAEEIAAKVVAVRNLEVEVAIVLEPAISGVAGMVLSTGWTAPQQITWVCWRR